MGNGDFCLVLLGVLLSVAFFTLVERKFLGLIHFRKGPRKLLFFGLLQPISDAIKLFSKEFIEGYKILFLFYFGGPLTGLLLIFLLWGIWGGFGSCWGRVFSMLYIFSLIRLGVYFLLFCGWGSMRKYSLFGCYRSISQTISYEVIIIFFCLIYVFLIDFFDLDFFSFYQFGLWFGFFCLLVFICWLYVVLAERNRTPFDFSEGESELVSGFNVEFGGGFFSLIFICEYGMIIFLCFLSVEIFGGGTNFFFKLLFICLFFVWVRCRFPRYRYDFLMESSWYWVLPVSLTVLIFSVVCFF